MKIMRIAAIAAALLTAGCTHFKLPGGGSYTSFFNSKTISKLRIDSKSGNTNTTVVVEGYKSSQAENLQAVSEGLGNAIIKASKSTVP